MKPFFRRKQEERGEIPSVWQRDDFSHNIKNQIWLELKESERFFICGGYGITLFDKIVNNISNYIKLETGTTSCINNNGADFCYGCLMTGILGFNKTDIAFTIVESFLNRLISFDAFDILEPKSDIIRIVENVNYRFREARIGYQFNVDAKCLLPFDDEIIFENAIEPAFNFLNVNGFEKAKSLFKDAFNYYINKDYEDAVNNCTKALESVIKTILQKQGVEYTKKDGITRLIDLLFSLDTFKAEHNDFICGLRNVFKEIPAVRNKESGHGKAESEIGNLDEPKTKLILNLAATLITYLSEKI